MVGVAGFGATLYQLSKVKSAADASVAAVNSLKIRLSQLDALQEVAQAEAAISALRSDMKEMSHDRWDHWAERLETALIVICELADGGELGSSPQLGVASRSAAFIVKHADQDLREDASARDKNKEALREISRALVAVRAYIQRNQ